jgi:hypothetical protein
VESRRRPEDAEGDRRSNAAPTLRRSAGAADRDARPETEPRVADGRRTRSRLSRTVGQEPTIVTPGNHRGVDFHHHRHRVDANDGRRGTRASTSLMARIEPPRARNRARDADRCAECARCGADGLKKLPVGGSPYREDLGIAVPIGDGQAVQLLGAPPSWRTVARC